MPSAQTEAQTTLVLSVMLWSQPKPAQPTHRQSISCNYNVTSAPASPAAPACRGITVLQCIIYSKQQT